MDARAERAGRNEALFRSVNDAISDLEQGWDRATEWMEMVCECGDEACRERIQLTPEEYEQVRASSDRFAIVPGHQAPEVEHVVTENDRFAVVAKKPGGPAELARDLDVRRR